MWIAVVAVAMILVLISIKLINSATVSKKLKESNSALRLGIFIKLNQKYQSIYGEDANFLAVGILNEILNEEPANDEGRSYRNLNSNLIRQKTLEISTMPEYADAISLLLFTQWTCLTGEASKHLTARADELSFAISPPIKMLETSNNNKFALANMIHAYATGFLKQH